MKIPKDLQRAAKLARATGWLIRPSGAGHIRWESPEGERVYTPHTPASRRRSIENALAKLKRAGLDI